jgi:hypothetical protein
MPAWKARLHPNEVVLVAAYVAKKRGQNLPSTRQPEGEVIPPWPTALSAPAATPAHPAEATPSPAPVEATPASAPVATPEGH